MQLWDELNNVFKLVMEFWSASSSSRLRKRFRKAFRQGYQEFRTVVSAIIHDGIQRGEFRDDIDPEAVAAALSGTWDALLLQALFDSSFDLLKIASKFLPVVIDGLRRPKRFLFKLRN